MTNRLQSQLRCGMQRFIHVTLACLLMACSGNVISQSPELETLLEQLVKSYGGKENLHKLNNQIQEWDVVALIGSRHGTDSRSIRVPDQLKVEVTYPGKKETRIVNSESSYVAYNKAPARVAMRPQRDAMRLQLMRLYSPLVLQNKIDSLSLTAQDESYVITLFEDGMRVDYIVNADNWRIEKVKGSMSINGSVMQFLTEYSNFTFRDGVLIHQNENKFAGGVNTAVLRLRKIMLDTDLKDADFLASDENATNARDDII